MSNRTQQTIFLIALIALVIAFLLVTVLSPTRAQDLEFVPVELDRVFFFSEQCQPEKEHLISLGVMSFTTPPGEPVGTTFSGEPMVNPGPFINSWQPGGFVVFIYGDSPADPEPESRYATVVFSEDGRVAYLLGTSLPQSPEELDNYDCGAYLVFAPPRAGVGL